MTDVKYRIVYVLARTNKADDDDTDVYVGSTSQSLEQRLRIHRHDAKRPGNKNNRLYVRMNEVGIENWEILPLLGRTCDKKQAYELEKNGLGSSAPISIPIHRLEKRQPKKSMMRTGIR